MSVEYPRVVVRSRAEWRAWLAQHHATDRGAWTVTYKQGSGAGPYVAYEDLVEEALCFGWIDSIRRTVDDESSRLLMTPRKPKSAWSRPNKERVERLVAAGLMAPAGRAAIEAAKANGAWSSIDAAQDLREPDDLRTALDATPDARRYWDAFPPSARRGILEWVGNAKTAATRGKRVQETARLAAQNLRANQWRQPKGGAG